MYSLASGINAEYFEAVARRRAVRTRALHWRAVLMSIVVSQRLDVICRGPLGALLVEKLIRFRSERAETRDRGCAAVAFCAEELGCSMLKNSAAAC